MDFVIIGLVAFLASGLTLYSGFGLGTVLLPAFALFFPAPVAVAATGLVHLLNGLFKGGLLWRQADWGVVLRFGLDPARFIATGVMIAVLIDLSRLPVYALTVGSAAGTLDTRQGLLVGWAVLCAFAGAWGAVRWLKKVTIGAVRGVVAAAMLAIGAALVAGLIGT